MEGDAALLAVIREGLATAVAQHQRGSLVAKIIQRQPPVLENQMEIHEHTWDGDRRYWRYSGQDVIRFPGKPESVQSSDNSEMILRPDLKCWHFPSRNYATIRRSPTERRRLSSKSVLELHPVRCWFSYDRGKTTWDRVLDPADVPQSVTHFEVEKADSDRVVILRHQPVGILRVEVSLAHGGNIISYRAETDKRIKSGTYDWVEYTPGNWRLKEMVQQQTPTSGSDIAEKYYRLEILKFDPRPRIPADRFQCSSFKLAEGTRFHSYDAQGNRILGKTIGAKGASRSTPDQSSLDELADQLRSSGFAAPERAP